MNSIVMNTFKSQNEISWNVSKYFIDASDINFFMFYLSNFTPYSVPMSATLWYKYICVFNIFFIDFLKPDIKNNEETKIKWIFKWVMRNRSIIPLNEKWREIFKYDLIKVLIQPKQYDHNFFFFLPFSKQYKFNDSAKKDEHFKSKYDLISLAADMTALVDTISENELVKNFVEEKEQMPKVPLTAIDNHVLGVVEDLDVNVDSYKQILEEELSKNVNKAFDEIDNDDFDDSYQDDIKSIFDKLTTKPPKIPNRIRANFTNNLDDQIIKNVTPETPQKMKEEDYPENLRIVDDFLEIDLAKINQQIDEEMNKQKIMNNALWFTYLPTSFINQPNYFVPLNDNVHLSAFNLIWPLQLSKYDELVNQRIHVGQINNPTIPLITPLDIINQAANNQKEKGKIMNLDNKPFMIQEDIVDNPILEDGKNLDAAQDNSVQTNNDDVMMSIPADIAREHVINEDLKPKKRKFFKRLFKKEEVNEPIINEPINFVPNNIDEEQPLDFNLTKKEEPVNEPLPESLPPPIPLQNLQLVADEPKIPEAPKPRSFPNQNEIKPPVVDLVIPPVSKNEETAETKPNDKVEEPIREEKLSPRVDRKIRKPRPSQKTVELTPPPVINPPPLTPPPIIPPPMTQPPMPPAQPPMPPAQPVAQMPPAILPNEPINNLAPPPFTMEQNFMPASIPVVMPPPMFVAPPPPINIIYQGPPVGPNNGFSDFSGNQLLGNKHINEIQTNPDEPFVFEDHKYVYNRNHEHFIFNPQTFNWDFIPNPPYIEQNKFNVNTGIIKLYGTYMNQGPLVIGDTTKFFELRVDNVSYTYEGNTAPSLDNVTFRIDAGTFHVFAGENGAGKSTMIKTLIGVLDGYDGIISINRTNILDVPELKKMVAYVSDNAIFPSFFTTYQYLYNIGRLSKIPSSSLKQKILLLLKELQIPEVKNKNPNRLSMGQKKKVLLIRALLEKARILILDEPAANLDPTTKIQIFDILKKLQQNGATIFISTHLLDDIKNYATHLTLISKGRILYSGPTSPTEFEEINKRFFAERSKEIDTASIIENIINEA